jgi:hypothetical protein
MDLINKNTRNKVKYFQKLHNIPNIREMVCGTKIIG